jgi:MOSC domain-containing protein YiiM
MSSSSNAAVPPRARATTINATTESDPPQQANDNHAKKTEKAAVVTLERLRAPDGNHSSRHGDLREDATVEDLPEIVAVHRSGSHSMTKPTTSSIRLLTGLGVEGDAHMGATVQHRSRVARDPSQPNLRQVHLIHAELHDELASRGFSIGPGDMGENITTRGVDLLNLPVGTRLHLGADAVVEVTGLRNPCAQLDGVRPGLMAAVLDRDAEGRLVRKAGIMGIVVADGSVRAGDKIAIALPSGLQRPLEPV